MKTSQVLTRRMGDFEVLQRTSDGYFDANALLARWNTTKGNTRKNMPDFVNAKNTKEFLIALAEELHANAEISALADFQPIKESKGRMTKKGKTQDQVWMQPYLFIKFAMWINPRFEVKVIKFVYDQLIEYRNEAGDSYRTMTSALSKIVDRSLLVDAIRDIAKAINYVIFNNHEPLLRNRQADEKCMKELCELQKDITKLLDFGFIKTIEGLKVHLRDRWTNKWQSRLLNT